MAPHLEASIQNKKHHRTGWGYACFCNETLASAHAQVRKRGKEWPGKFVAREQRGAAVASGPAEREARPRAIATLPVNAPCKHCNASSVAVALLTSKPVYTLCFQWQTSIVVSVISDRCDYFRYARNGVISELISGFDFLCSPCDDRCMCIQQRLDYLTLGIIVNGECPLWGSSIYDVDAYSVDEAHRRGALWRRHKQKLVE